VTPSNTSQLEPSSQTDEDNQYEENNHVPVAAQAVTTGLIATSERETCDEAQLRDSRVHVYGTDEQ